jgi:excinuclease ABC subunit A
MKEVRIRGAREHNLKGVDLRFPRDSLVVFTGVSGSGKSSLAYDTVFREGQRRYLESLSAYARQFLGKIEKPKLESIEGLSPTVAITQKTISRNPRSTVGTVTELYDFFRLLMARLGTPHCPSCGQEVVAQSPEMIADRVFAESKPGDRLMVLAPIVRGRKGSYRRELEDLRKRGFLRARIDGRILRLDEEISLHRYKKHDLEVVIDRLKADPARRERLLDSLEQAIGLGQGFVGILRQEMGKGKEVGRERFEMFSALSACPNGHGSVPELEPLLFSFTNPKGACPECQGLGETRVFSEELLVEDESLSLREGALRCFNKKGFLHYSRLHMDEIDQILGEFGGSVDVPLRALPKRARAVLFRGAGERRFATSFRYEREGMVVEGDDRMRFAGVVGRLQAIWDEYRPPSLARFQRVGICRTCGGARLRPEALSVTWKGRNLAELVGMTLGEALALFEGQARALKKRGGREALIGKDLFTEILDRLRFLNKVGLSYLRLDRRAGTLSGGEAQRIRLASQVGSGLRGVLYVLDEPSIGLHARDNERLIETLKELRDRGNTVCVVEHDEETMLAADYLVDVGPGAGIHGGRIVAAGGPEEVLGVSESLTARYLRGELGILVPERRSLQGARLRLRGARLHNLAGLDVEIPLGCFVCVSGVSGSGKSTLVHHILKKALAHRLQGAEEDAPSGALKKLEGLEEIDRVIEIDQAPIGRTPRSNPATYTGLWTHVRDLFASLPESRVRGYPKGRFSFNVKGGRCEACEGAGVKSLEMQLLESVQVPCEVCEEKRFNRETLEIHFRGRNIFDVLEMTIEEAGRFFANHPKMVRILDLLNALGLGYLKLGQTSTTLSGGEAQRIKLAAELAKRGRGKTLYILDEPTTGLHFADVQKLLDALQALVDQGNTVLVIEHNLDVLKSADWVLDLGPEGGEGGGLLVAAGPPEAIARVKDSHTGRVLKKVLRKARPGPAQAEKASRKRKKALSPGKGGKGSVKQGGGRDLVVRGARQHNLKGVDARFPAASFSVVTGLSGSGKTSLAFDTVFREGQRRFLESLSTYARRFLGRLERAPVDSIEGLLPAIAIDQKSAGRNPRSTVGTQTEILDYLRLLFARVGVPHCPEHGEALVQNSPSMLAGRILEGREAKACLVLAPSPLPPGLLDEDLLTLVMERRKEWKEEGFVRYACLEEGAGLGVLRLEEDSPAERLKGGLFLVVDRLKLKARLRSRLAEALELAGRWGEGLVAAQIEGEGLLRWSLERSCTQCGFHLPLELAPRFFSFNHHQGACPECDGIGTRMSVDMEAWIAAPDKPLFQGALRGGLGPGLGFLLHPRRSVARTAQAMALAHGFDLHKKAWKALSREQRELVLHGTDGEVFEVAFVRERGERKRSYKTKERWPGLIPILEEKLIGNERELPEGLRRETRCPSCEGSRLSPAARHVLLAGKNLPQLCAEPIGRLLDFFAKLKLKGEAKKIASELLAELRRRLGFLDEMGLSYLSLDRRASTLSGGEAQRIRLAGQCGNQLTGTLYVLDEPTIGLHPSDTDRLLKSLLDLRTLGNTVIAVEHDEEVIRRADWVVDIGPGAGRKGGRVQFEGSPSQLLRSKTSETGVWLAKGRSAPRAESRRSKRVLEVDRLQVHNLKKLRVQIPVGCLCVVTGPSGSGKSSLVLECIVPALQGKTGPYRLKKDGGIHQIQVVDQGLPSKSPRSCPATYLGIWGAIRELFAKTLDAKRLGFGPGRFSFNNKEGRCPHCQGQGELQIEMHFLADVWIPCDLCRGKRFNEQTLQVRWKGKTIAELCQMEVEEAKGFFQAHRRIARPLEVLSEVGLGYLKLGGGLHILSGGEAQRIKLAAELCKRPDPGRLYVLDEPTTGLHRSDVERLLKVLDRLVEQGASVLVIEHHMAVAARADWILDLGPGAGEAGGRIVFAGTPAELQANKSSPTSAYL